MKKVPFYDLSVTGGFWAERQKTVEEKTVYAVYDRFFETGRVETMDCKLHDVKPHIFWGSDVVKWMEGAAYILEKKEDPRLRKLVDELLDRIEAGVAEDGYYNSYFNSPEPQWERFSDRDKHELYSLGHLIEAAVALSHIGEDRLLKIACKNADLVDRVFRKEDSAGFTTPGHEEIELALVKLWEATGEKRYLELSEFFVRKRGTSPKDVGIYRKDDGSGIQSHLPMMEQRTAEGHAVRAVYLYSAVADLAEALKDQELRALAEDLFDDIYEKKMYITGGIGSSSLGERFTVPYHLPNRDAYAETCAALGLALFARRMYTMEPDSRYGDAAERALYNGMIAGLSLEGDAFFYSNPLEIDLSREKIPMSYSPATLRQKVFGCSCCPPNLVRLIPSVADFVYTYDEAYLYVHQYIPTTGKVDGVDVLMKTEYPVNGRVRVAYSGKKLALRKPAWCTEVITQASYTEKKGYLYFDTSEVEVEFVMKPTFYLAGHAVHDDIGRVALMRGPVVYCLEGKDQEASVFRCCVEPEGAVRETEELYTTYYE